MTVKVTQPSINLREKISEVDKPSGIAGEAILRSETPQEVFNYINAGRRNLIINGAMQISQRGDYSSPVSVVHDTYRIDRFMVLSSPLSSNFQHIDVTIDGVAKKAMRVVATSSGNGIIGFNQRIEKASVPIGSILTVSCKVRTNHPQVGYRTNTFRGYSGDGPTKTINDGNWHTLTWTFDSTGTTNSAPDILLVAYNNGGVTISVGDYIEVTDMQLEVGTVATPFEHRSYGEELALCHRYYVESNWVGTQVIDANNTNRNLIPSPPQPMRSNPTITVFHPSTGTANQGYNFSSGGTATISYIGGFDAANIFQVGTGAYLQSNVSNRYTFFRIKMDAEL